MGGTVRPRRAAFTRDGPAVAPLAHTLCAHVFPHRQVPWGQLVGATSLAAIDQMYTKYGEKVSQGKIFNRGNEYTKVPLSLLSLVFVLSFNAHLSHL